MYLYQNRKINIDSQITIEGVTYPNLRDPELRQMLGITEVPEPVRPTPEDEYYVTENEDGSLNITRKSDEQIAQQNQAKTNAASLKYLADTDWYVVRFMESGAPVPQEVLDARTAARAAIVHMEPV